MPAAFGSKTGRLSRPIRFFLVFLFDLCFALALLGFSGCLDMLPFSSPLQATAKLRTRDGTLLIGINLPNASRLLTTVRRTELGTTLLIGLNCTTVAPAYFRCPSLVSGCPKTAC